MAWSEAGSRYVVIGISTDDDRAAALTSLRHSHATVSHYIDSRLTLEHMLGASTIPLTVLVDAGGRLVARFRGARKWDSVESIRMIEHAFANAGRPTPTRQALWACAHQPGSDIGEQVMFRRATVGLLPEAVQEEYTARVRRREYPRG